MMLRENERRLERKGRSGGVKSAFGPRVRRDTHYVKWAILRERGCCLVTTDADYTERCGLTKKKEEKKKKARE